MQTYEVTSDRLAGHQRGDRIQLDPAAVNVPALIAAEHVKPARPAGRGRRGDDRTD